MSFGRLTIRHVACAGPGKDPAIVYFKAGANAIIGLSNTGKSYILELIDFMLGGEKIARELPEAAGYDTILMGIETSAGEKITLRRSSTGGGMHVLEGLVDARADGTVLETLAENESKRGPRSINQFYLEKLGLSDTVLRSKKNATQKLTMRTLSKLALVSENRIIEERSPILSGQFTLATPEKSLFKLLVSGVDDSALVEYVAETKTREDKLQRAAAVRVVLEERKSALEERGLDEQTLRQNLQTLDKRLEGLRGDTGNAEREWTALRRRIRRLAETHDLAEKRMGDLEGLIFRFELLQSHYRSDLDRLKAIAEAAEALDSLAPGPCPLCGAPAEAHNHDDVCEADLPALAEAARAEASRIARLSSDLSVTEARAHAERAELQTKLLEIARQSDAARKAVAEAEQEAREQRSGYAQVVEEWSEIKDQLRSFEALNELEAAISVDQQVDEAATSAPDVSAPRANTDEFAQEVGTILQAWGVPGCQRVFFDQKESDLQLDNKMRGAQGKGLRALTHAAFVIGLMTYCLKNNRPHPGFVVVDSPLLSYRGDVFEEDPSQDIKKTTVDDAFYTWLATSLPAGQVIVIENREAPQNLDGPIQIHSFMGPGGPRTGFFPGR